MAYKNILVEKKAGVAKIIINRPPLNILDIDTLEEMSQALAELKTDDEVLSAQRDWSFSALRAIGSPECRSPSP